MCRSLVALALLLPAARAEVEYLGEAAIAGTAGDLSGLKGRASDGTPADRLGGLGSAIAYTGEGSRYLLASDRGPKDGASDYVCRWHAMEVVVTPGAKAPVRAKLVATTLLTDEKGRRFTGSSAAGALRLDPEGLRVGPKGTVFVADEYGPSVSEFRPDGRRLRTLAVPPRFGRGLLVNRGFEGLALAPDGSRLVAAMQSPLTPDGGRDGVNVRLLEIDAAAGKTREFVYPLASPVLGVSEILALNARQFLVLERDALGGKDARVKRLYHVSTADATDVGHIDALPKGRLPAGVVAVTKALFLDLLEPRFGLAGPGFPEKVEGLAFGPDLPDGRRLLLVTADNDFLPDRPLRIFAFAVSGR